MRHLVRKSPSPAPQQKRSYTLVKKPKVTLFLSSSIDGKITSHDSDRFDKSPEWKSLPGIRSILQRFYDFSDNTTLPLTPGYAVRFADKGIVEKPQQLTLSLIVFDYTNELTPKSVVYLTQCFKKLYVVGSRSLWNRIKKRPKNLLWIPYKKTMPLGEVMLALAKKKITSITIHSDAPMNARWLASGIVDAITIVVAPLMVGGNGTPLLMDVIAMNMPKTKISPILPLQLVETRAIGDSYLFLRYEVSKNNQT